MDRSLEMLVGLLGIMKAGGAFLPLDPAYPKHRLGLILEDAAISVLLTREPLGGLVAGISRKTALSGYGRRCY